MDYAALDDKRLLELLQEENERAYGELYRRYWEKIYSQALAWLKSPEAAQDIVQDVFLKIWTHKETLLQVREFRPYLLVSARNLIISSLRTNVFHAYLDPEAPLEEEVLLPEKQLSFKESVQLLHQAIEQLPPQQQRAYQLSRQQGMRYEDIAREMQISKLTVRVHISKAINFIRKYLEKNYVSLLAIELLLLSKKS
ncbi:RNA polymerase sigma-70 factor [Paraflavisolibacter sp. H34]|uniref:RNA polymerase sigma-70 factor n=1 Tax=Huijunlia imazamoxiresistens TaxID=3127457 RepID=UPI0030166B47